MNRKENEENKGTEGKKKIMRPKQAFAQGTGRVPKGQGCCSMSPVMCPGDGPTNDAKIPDGRQYKKRADAELQTKQNKQCYVQLMGQGRHKRPKGRQRRRAKE